MAITRDEIGKVLARLQDAWLRRDITTLGEIHSEDGVVESPFAGGMANGRAEIERVYEAFFHTFPDVTLQTDEPLIDGNRVVLIGRISGTDRGGLLGMSPTGRSFDIPIVSLFDFDGALIKRERRIYDFTGLAVQVGAIKAKPAS
jgi:steroid delta-isomerase-like uncharacterized protein